jgi:hypothetical protein
MRLLARVSLLAALLAAGRRTVAAQARPGGADTVLSAVQRLFDAMGARDTSAARALLLPGARFRALRRETAGDAAADTAPAQPEAQSDTAFLRRLATRRERLLERIWAPVVRVEGPLATVWAAYDFHVDGRWSHCGVDAVTLIRTGAGWRVSGIDYTVQRRGCVPSPLGPPAGPPRAPAP